jgi:hypothetical protein
MPAGTTRKSCSRTAAGELAGKQNEIRVAFESCWATYKRLVEEQQRQAMAGGLQ